MGTPQQIKSKLDQLAKLKATQPGRIPGLPGVVPGGVPVPTAPLINPKTGLPLSGSGSVKPATKQFSITSFDPRFDFYVINAGSGKGIKTGDKLIVYRENKAVGKIIIVRVQPTVSIAKIDNTSPNPLLPFKPGDKVMKIK